MPLSAEVGPTFARFRFDSQGGLTPTGLAYDGEVEDYAVDLQATEVTVEVSPSSVVEDGADVLEYTFTRAGVLTGDLTVNFSVGGVAVFSTDYSEFGADTFDGATGTVTIPDGQATATVTVDPTPDIIVEATETVILTVTPGTGYQPGTPNSATGEITDDDTATFTIDDETVDEDAGTMTFTVSLDYALDIDVVVDVTYADVTATGGGVDYDSTAGTVTFLAGETGPKSVVAPVPIVDDIIVEATETFTASLSTATALGDRDVDLTDTATGTITDNDTATFTIDDETVDEDAGTMTFTVSLDYALDIDVVVDVTYADVTATGGGVDYDSTAGTVTFLAGETGAKSVVAPVPIVDDIIVEATETFTASLSTATAYGDRDVDLTDTATGTITDNDTATFTIDDETVDEDAGTMTFTVSLDYALDIDVVVDVTYADVTATGGGVDYDSTAGTVTFLAGETGAKSVVAPVPIVDDIIVEATETFTASLSTATAYGDRDVDLTDTATGTITDNDTATFTIDDETVDEDAGTMTFTVSLDYALDTDVVVDVAYADVTATGGGVDYDSTAGTVTFLAGETGAKSVVAPVPIVDDIIVEATETFTASLSTATALGDRDVVLTDTATGTITDNDTATFTIDDETVDEDAGTMTFTVSLDYALDIDVMVDVTYADVTATGGGVDYDSTAGTVTFLAGETGAKSVVAPVPIVDDIIVEATETFTASLSTATALGDRDVVLTDTATGTITDNDTATFTIDDETVDEDAGTMTFTVSLDYALDIDVVVDVTYADVTATGGGVDYDSTAGTVTFLAGETGPKSVVAPVPIVDDIIVEATETFTASLSTATAYGDRDVDLTDTATGTITDNDTATFTIDDKTVNEDAGTMTFTVSLDYALDIDVVVDVTYADVTATGGGVDYDSTAGTVTFLAGETGPKSVVAPVPIVDDAIVEGTETFTASLSTATALGDRDVVLTDTATGTIVDNEGTSEFTIDDETVDEDAGTMTFTVSLNNALDIDVVVDVTYSDVTATGGGVDYDSTAGSVTFLAGETGPKSVVAPVPIVDDIIVEATETFTASLSTATPLGGRPVDLTDTATGTIVDNDTATFTIDDETVDEDAGTMTFTVSLDYALDTDVVVDVAYADVTATGGGVDYDSTAGTVTFLAGETGPKSVVAPVPIVDDIIVEATETFTASLSTATAYGDRDVDLTDTATGTITDNDTATFTIDDETVDEDAGTMTFTVSLDYALDIDVVVDVTYADVTATGGGVDYDSTAGTVTFLAGETGAKSVVAPVPIVDDIIVEATETFTASLSTATALGDRDVVLTDTATGTITDNDTATFTIDDETVDEDAGTMTFTVSLDYALDIDVMVDVTYADVTATGGGVDYDSTAGTVTFLAGETGAKSVVAPAPIVDDIIVEATETFTASLSTATALGDRDVVLTDTATGTITDNDTATFTIDDETVDEDAGTMTFTVSLDYALDIDVVVDVTYADVTATGGGVDYDSTAGTVTFLAGETGPKSVVASVTIVDDAIVEGTETFTASLSTATALGDRDVVLTDTATGTIVDDDIDIVGQKFEDSDGDGVKDAGEPGLVGWTVYLYLDDGDASYEPGTDDALVDTQTTDAQGNYYFTGLTDGQRYWVAEESQSGWVQTTPATEYREVNFTIAGKPFEDEDFGNFQYAVISGHKYDQDSHPLEGWTIYIDANDSGDYTAGEPTATTDASGTFQFDYTNVGAGNLSLLGTMADGSARPLRLGEIAPANDSYEPNDDNASKYDLGVAHGGTFTDCRDITATLGPAYTPPSPDVQVTISESGQSFTDQDLVNTITGNEEDWFEVTAINDGIFTVELPDSDGDFIKVEVRDMAGTTVLASSAASQVQGDDAHQRVDLLTTVGTIYTIRVYSASAIGDGAYTLRITNQVNLDAGVTDRLSITGVSCENLIGVHDDNGQPLRIFVGTPSATDPLEDPIDTPDRVGTRYDRTLIDSLYASTGVTSVSVLGGAGNDVIRVGDDVTKPTTLLGGGGDDWIHGANSKNTILGEDGNDVLVGGSADDVIYGGDGDDIVLGEGGNDNMFGQDGNDSLYGGAGVDLIRGGNDDDLIAGGEGADLLYGENGNDTLYATSGVDTRIVEGRGTDSTVADADGLTNPFEVGSPSIRDQVLTEWDDGDQTDLDSWDELIWALLEMPEWNPIP